MQTVTYKEGDHWVIQGLEHDVSGQGDTPERARRRLQTTVTALAGELGSIPQAPQRFWDMERDSEGIGG